MSYTALAVVGVLAALALDLAVLRTRVVTRRVFWASYAIVVTFQLLTNGWLTGRDILVYDDDAILGCRLVFAPVEKAEYQVLDRRVAVPLPRRLAVALPGLVRARRARRGRPRTLRPA